MKLRKQAFAAAAVAVLTLPAFALPVVFSGSLGGRSASASFDTVGSSSLQVVLTNTSANDVLVPVDVLTGVFFNIGGNPALTPLSAITGGTTFLGTTTVSGFGSAVGGEWAYLNGLSQYSANSGISSSGLGLFGPGNLFPPGIDLSSPLSPAGLQYGISSAGDNTATGNAAVLGNELTRNSVSFLLSGLPAGFLLSSISSVTFQYGTALTEPSVVGSSSSGGPSSSGTVPEPNSSALAVLGLALLGAALGARARRSKG